jgi:uncharacterized RDD family membrane protein YckC
MAHKKLTMNKYDVIEVRVRRFFAMVIDWYLTNMLAVIPITFYFRGNDYLQPYMFELNEYSFQIGLLLGVYAIIIGIIYYVIIPSFVWKGQTLGKKLCKIQVIDQDTHDVTLLTMIKRELFGAVILEGGIVITATYLRKLLPLFGLVHFVTPLKYIAYALTIISIGYAYFQPMSQAFHDKIANTLVIKK